MNYSFGNYSGLLDAAGIDMAAGFVVAAHVGSVGHVGQVGVGQVGVGHEGHGGHAGHNGRTFCNPNRFANAANVLPLAELESPVYK